MSKKCRAGTHRSCTAVACTPQNRRAHRRKKRPPTASRPRDSLGAYYVSAQRASVTEMYVQSLRVNRLCVANETKDPCRFRALLLGSVHASILTPQQMKLQCACMVLADGRSIVGTPLHTFTGQTHVPDLRSQFLRGADDESNPLGQTQDFTTALPENGFVTTVNGQFTLGATRKTTVVQSIAGGAYPVAQTANVLSPDGFQFVGAHSHVVLGGDAETRPKNTAVNFFVYTGSQACEQRCAR